MAGRGSPKGSKYRVNLQRYTFHVRLGFKLTMYLPKDLSQGEIDRLAAMIKTGVLPMETLVSEYY